LVRYLFLARNAITGPAEEGRPHFFTKGSDVLTIETWLNGIA